MISHKALKYTLGRISPEERELFTENKRGNRNKTMSESDNGTFEIQNTILPYLRVQHRNTGDNERSVEVPIALKLYSTLRMKSVDMDTKARILEIGSVLPHYHPRWEKDSKENKSVYPHLCIDIHEEFPGVINPKTTEWEPSSKDKFDLIVSISAGEHIINQDINSSDDTKLNQFRSIIVNMISWLAKDGLMMITFPVNQPPSAGGGRWMNLYINDLIHATRDQTSRIRQSDPNYIWKMSRMGFGVAGNKWHEVEVGGSPDLPYYTSIPSAGTVYFLFWGNLWRFWK